ncbi:MAG: hypothetical protein ABIH23_04270 [bacterium]
MKKKPGLKVWTRCMERSRRQGKSVAGYVEPFYEQIDAPSADTEGSHIALSGDGKGVRIRRSEREGAEEEKNGSGSILSYARAQPSTKRPRKRPREFGHTHKNRAWRIAHPPPGPLQFYR